ncbi:MAG: hypothetical protein WD490_10890 [Opitutales bacterium]
MKSIKSYLRVAHFAIFAISLFLPSISGARIELVTFNAVYSEDFDSFDGTSDPFGWRVSDLPGATASEWLGTGTGSSTSGGLYAFGSAEYSLGFLPSATRAIFADLSFVNATGTVLDSFTFGYDAEQWRASLGGRDNGWTVSYRVGDSAFEELDALRFFGDFTLQTGAIDGGVTTSLEQTVHGLSMGDGEILEFRFFGDNTGTSSTSGSRQGVAIDNVQVTVAPIPEPSTYAFLAGIMVFCVALFFRRRFPNS